MNFKDVENLVSKFKKQPLMTLFVLVFYLLLVAAIAYLSAYSGEKGKQHSIPKSTNTGTTAAPKETVPKKRANNDGATINQRTQGDQSPAIVSGGNVTIEYNAHKDKNKKE